MASKQFINSADNAVHETLSGLCTVYPGLNYHSLKRVVVRADFDERDKNKVSTICGGGSGHEPFAAGFVGRGMLSASVAGSVFAAPPPNNVLHALKCVRGNGGTLVIIPNYTGDCLNFGIAIERARQEGLKIAEIVIGDDCSISSSELGRAGRRGLVGMIFVMKIAGALSQRLKPLEEVHHHAQIVSENIATFGVGMRACSLPGQGPIFKLPDDEMEVGLGVHGEAGYDRMKIKNSREIVSIMLTSISQALSLTKGDDVAVIINNFGGTSQLEQGILAHDVAELMRKNEVNVVRTYSGMLMTSLDGAGVHVSVLKLPEVHEELYIQCLDDPTDAPCWPGCSLSRPIEFTPQLEKESHEIIRESGKRLENSGIKIFKECLKNACQAIIENEEILNNLDRGCGDGDCGTTHKTLANGILSSLESLKIPFPASLLMELSGIAEECMGGTSGAVYSLFFATSAAALVRNSEENWNKLIADAWRSGIDGVMKYSKARLGDRTMLDALEPAWKAFNDNSTKSLRDATNAAAEAARKGSAATEKMVPRAGRASYVKNSEFLTNVDAGAFGVVIWLTALSETLSKFQ
ncbi:bifunctional ATP-dependent dihydroxyacetone kinase/FAD-AMP lyase (cyclizing) [Fopius arisanus]|uniref:Triokinase/FMN cyclase n=1 Tax=Fopius arisanus TaxID=64838 RepID=A0A9R1SZ66_9HYME|nr:PREDICTED: bifunctional ATP-dependent dihydroxyacetone kinase/FAD-AMP lyase (cyclizing)-like [Fopius arisanus]